ncbi:hypothetical protein M7I_1313 [Glarea lozoyensis 74030]|uniref:Uncharacterized protein n=1 Tax=Glarea lozoyensis (strain ATCC 74030 / MF5533) TaxID=1104152 RepID=H0EFQ7_GLAL7|nr:hypothetical protein M7I_1313 [Glarea lozoyensis 74030]
MTNKGIHFQGRPLELLEENENVDGETENGSSASFMHDRYKLTQLPDAIQFDIESLLMSGLTMAIVFINEAGQTFFLVVNVMDFQISIELLGPFTYLGKTLPGRSRKNWAIFDDYFQQASWRTRSREASISWDSEGIELVAHLQRIWSEREQGRIRAILSRAVYNRHSKHNRKIMITAASTK